MFQVVTGDFFLAEVGFNDDAYKGNDIENLILTNSYILFCFREGVIWMSSILEQPDI